MKLNKYNIAASAIGLFGAMFGLSSCADDLGVKTDDLETSGIVLMVPDVELAAEFPTTKAEAASSAAEGALSELYLYVFKTDGGNSELVDRRNLKNDNALSVGNTYYKAYNLDLQPGSYKFYLLGNISDYAGDVSSLGTEAAIKALTLKFDGKTLAAGNLPMACLSKVALSEGPTTADQAIEITKEDAKKGKKIYADLSFLLSKVRYTVLFDNSANGISAAFGTNIADFSSDDAVSFTNILNTTPIEGSKTVAQDAEFTSANGKIETFTYPTEVDYPKESSTNLSATTTDKNKCAWQGVVYLPENLIAGKQTIFKLKGQAQTSTGTRIYDLGKEITLCPSNVNGGNFSRGNLYDIVVSVKNYDGVNVQVNAATWTPTSLLADFVHTYLNMESTKAKVTSLDDDVLKYDTDGRGGITFELTSNGDLQDKNGVLIPLTTPVIKASFNTNDKTITFSANSNIDVTKLKENSNGEIIGTAEGYIKAGNIKKKIEIEYDLSPIFSMDPQSLTFNWGDVATGTTLGSQTFTFKTNLGGIKLFLSDENGTVGTEKTSNLAAGFTDTKTVTGGSSTISLKSGNTSEGEGSITVTSIQDPKQVAHHYFLAQAANKSSEKVLLMVTVIPNNPPYRVYFRAINDYQDDLSIGNSPEASEFLLGKWSEYPSESTTKDWWRSHKIYVYGQEGETGAAFSDSKQWKYNEYESDPANAKIKRDMISDNTNTGWYYTDIANGLTPYTASAGYEKEVITPGRTLFIFHSENGAHAVHRCSHHNDPGVPLFNYEDREGWYLYDPTREPYYNVYDEKPEVVDVTYEIYTSFQPTMWYRDFGIATGNSAYDENKKFKMYGLISSGSGIGQTTKSGNYYKTQLKFKAPKGEYAKNIQISSGSLQYVYVCDQTGWGAGWTPQVHIWKDGVGDFSGWDNDPKMEACSSPTGYETDKRWFRYKIPEKFKGNVSLKIHEENKNEWVDQYDLNNTTVCPIAYIKSDKQYQDGEEKYRQVSWNSDTRITTGTTLTLFGGQNFKPSSSSGSSATIVGYYNGSNWVNARP